MRPVATDVACYVVCTCMYVCIGHTGDACRMDEPIEMPASRATNEPYTSTVLWVEERKCADTTGTVPVP